VPALTNAIKSLKALESPVDGKLTQQNAIAVDSMMLISVQAVGNALTGNLNDKDAAIFNAKMESNTAEMIKLQATLNANLEKFRKDNGIILETKNNK
jgi:glycine cleavage system H lipoate-binding protein